VLHAYVDALRQGGDHMGTRTEVQSGSELVLDDGRRLLIRPIQPDDTDRLIAIDRAALVAQTDAGDLVAVVRYDRLAGTSDAEVAVVVQDDYQHHTLGTTLLRLLTQHASERGITRFIADVLTENGPMFRAFRDVHLVGTTEYERGVAHLILPVPGG